MSVVCIDVCFGGVKRTKPAPPRYPLTQMENEMAHPATEKRGGNPDVKRKPEREKPKDPMERKLEQGLVESMTGSDPVSVTQPPKNKHDEKKKS